MSSDEVTLKNHLEEYLQKLLPQKQKDDREALCNRLEQFARVCSEYAALGRLVCFHPSGGVELDRCIFEALIKCARSAYAQSQLKF